MTPEERIKELERRISRLESSLSSVAGTDSSHRKAIEKIVGNDSEFSVTDYDQAVNEEGTSFFLVPKQFDGLAVVNNRLFGFYNP